MSRSLPRLAFEARDEVLVAEQAGGIQRGGLAGGGVGVGGKEGVDNRVFLLEDGTGQRGLAAIIEQVDVRAGAGKCGNQLGVAVIGGEHDKGLAFVVNEVDIYAVVDIGEEVQVALARHVEESTGEFLHLRLRHGF